MTPWCCGSRSDEARRDSLMSAIALGLVVFGQSTRENPPDMATFDDIKAGARLRGLDPAAGGRL
jgi:hypothetical protein